MPGKVEVTTRKWLRRSGYKKETTKPGLTVSSMFADLILEYDAI